ncbi:cation:proton antiporter, partial [Bacteroides thetaiotaomicron]|uniref:monovalent cation/H(+) antiporter subunit G n=1 Tax=Bacteroides thetaiotaomicron TaxID=818 RepID=UPI0019270CCC
DVLSLIFIGLGALFVLSASIGLVRFKDSLSRVHAVTKPQTVGLILTVIGAIIRVIGSPDFNIAHRGDLGILVLLVLFA